ncbi:uncharacterized protein LOC134001225 [Scomber scombrus]|uniref:uncharacterized protein LOC134001225 n=1 Tax=Scomber scombrus TaxID=13677 RepID=UPI002DDB24A2|nr:uncharacterized protein LOC134001225 [Scomber scombrus]
MQPDSSVLRHMLVNSILTQFHDNQGHYGQGICQREISKHFYWSSMTRDLARWISSCHTCLNRTKRKWLRCSVYNCTNCCGPVERGLGLTFHKFPLHNAALLAQWLKAVGRHNWHPRLRSSVCSTHFTEDCFDRSGDKVDIHPDAVPSLLVHDSTTQSKSPNQPAAMEEAYFAKYDAVERYLGRRIYPPGLSYVEKNTFRRFCKKFVIKDDKLHITRGDRVRLVLRSRQQVETALTDYHNELNHLDANKCLRLLNERYFWKTMRPDVVQWIDGCSQCSRKRRKKPNEQMEGGGMEMQLEGLRSPQIHNYMDSENDDYYDDDDGGGGGGDDDEGGGSDGDSEMQPAVSSEDRVSVTPVNSEPRIPILLRLRTPIKLPPRTQNNRFVTRIWSVNRVNASQSEAQTQSNGSKGPPQGQSGALKPEQEDEEEEEEEEQKQTQEQEIQIQPEGLEGTTTKTPLPVPEPQTQQKPQQATSKSQLRKTQSHLSSQPQRAVVQRLAKRRRGRDPEADSSNKRSSSCGLEPVVAPSTKPWPVFTIAGSAQTQTAKLSSEVNSAASSRRSKRLQARTVIQQCSQAKVKIRPALDGADAQWAEIHEGIVVYVCFFHGATEDITYEMANSLMTTKFFRKDSGHTVSVLDLPGSVLLIPQESLIGELVPRRRMQYKGGCELWWGAQLFSNLVSSCREFMSESAKCTKAGVKVEQGVYGQKQEIVLNSTEPLTVLLEF